MKGQRCLVTIITDKVTKITDKCKQERTGGDGILNET